MIEYTINDQIYECEYISTALNQIISSKELRSAELRTEHHTYEIMALANKYELTVLYHGAELLEVSLASLSDLCIRMDVVEF